MYGADVDQLVALGRSMTVAADQVDSMRFWGQRAVHTAGWSGPDGADFMGQWQSSLVPQLTSVVSALRDAGASLMRQAAQQRDASAAIGGGTISATGIVPCTVEDPARVDDALGRLQAALDTGGLGVTPSDLETIRAEFGGLSSGERAAVFARLSDQELAVLKDQMQESQWRGGWSSVEQHEFLRMLLPSLDAAEARRLMGPEWVDVVDEPYRVHAASDPQRFAESLMARTRDAPDGYPAVREDEIEIRAMHSGAYVVVLPGVVDLSAGPLAWEGTNGMNSARDMHYAKTSELDSSNGSTTGDNAYAFAVKEAMRTAGVPDGAEVMLVGHSFGAYTALELASDPSFNQAFGSGGEGYQVSITSVLAGGAEAGLRLGELPDSTSGLLVNNMDDRAYQGELILPTTMGTYDAEVIFHGGTERHGHGPENYEAFLRSTGHPTVDGFAADAHERFGGGGEAVRVKVKDPYRVPPPQHGAGGRGW